MNVSLTVKSKEELFDNILGKIVNAFGSGRNRVQLVGSYALYLQGVCELNDVHDLDVVIFSTPLDMETNFNTISIFANTNDITYPSLTTRRIPVTIDGVNVCIFLSSDKGHVKIVDSINIRQVSFNNIGKLMYNGAYVKPMMEILKVKSKMGRVKDIESIECIANKIINIIPKK